MPENLKISGLDAIPSSNEYENTVIIAISVGAKNHEGEKLNALVEEINKNIKSKTITNCIIAVCDTLQRHNYLLNEDMKEKDAVNTSRKEGDRWINDNILIIKNLQIPYQIKRWDDWLLDERYKTAQKDIMTLFEQDSGFLDAISSSANTFSSRFTSRYEELGFDEKVSEVVLKQRCRDYLLEECAIIMKLWPAYNEKNHEHILYPGKMTKALAYAYEKFVTKKNLFTWNKFLIKKLSPLESNLPAVNLFPINFNSQLFQSEKDKQLFLGILACATGIVESTSLSKEDKGDLLAQYTCSLFKNNPKFSGNNTPSSDGAHENSNK